MIAGHVAALMQCGAKLVKEREAREKLEVCYFVHYLNIPVLTKHAHNVIQAAILALDARNARVVFDLEDKLAHADQELSNNQLDLD